MREKLANARQYDEYVSTYVASLRNLPKEIGGLRGHIAELTLYPIKSLDGLEVQSAEATNAGLSKCAGFVRDRAAMIGRRQSGEVDGKPYDYVRFSQREAGVLALARASFSDGLLKYEAPEMSPLQINLEQLEPKTAGEVVNVKVTEQRPDRGDIWSGVKEDGPITAWVRELVKKRMGSADPIISGLEVILPLEPSLARPVIKRLGGGDATPSSTRFSDGGQLLVASQGTLNWMNADLRKAGEREIAMRAFRPNIVIAGMPPNAEDLIRSVLILRDDGEPIRLNFADPCVRCDVTRVDGQTGLKPDGQPLRWLSKNRPPHLGNLNSVTFGINAVISAPEKNGSTIHVGDVVVVETELDG